MIVCKYNFLRKSRFATSTNFVNDMQNLPSLAVPLPTCKIYRRGRFFEKIKGSGYRASSWHVTDRNYALARLLSPVAITFLISLKPR